MENFIQEILHKIQAMALTGGKIFFKNCTCNFNVDYKFKKVFKESLKVAMKKLRTNQKKWNECS